MESVRSFLQLPDDAPTGRGIRVGVVDTGIDYQHPDLERAIDPMASIDCTAENPEDGDLMDQFGHGTQISGIIAGSGDASDGKYRGIAPDVSLVVLKVAGGRTSEPRAVSRALTSAVQQGLQIVNLSFGSNPRDPRSKYKDQPAPWVWPANAGLAKELRHLAEAGLLCILSAGNNGDDGEGTMGQNTGLEEVLAVGACDCEGVHCRTSSMGPYYVNGNPFELFMRAHKGPLEMEAEIRVPKPDFVVPGAEMVLPRSSACPVHRKAQKLPSPLGARYCYASGTSMAAAVATGLAACALERLKEGERELGDNVGRVLRRILRAAAREEPKEDVNRYGAGILRWPAIDVMIHRFHTNPAFYREMLAP